MKQIPNVLHLDIEAHTLNTWSNYTNKTANEFLDLVDKINDEIVQIIKISFQLLFYEKEF